MTKPAPHPCPICARPLIDTDGRYACERCLTQTRTHLAGILTMYTELPAHLGQISSQIYDQARGGGDEHTLPGGTILALLAPGSDGGAARKLTRTDRERGHDGREHRHDNQPDDTPSVAWTLASWEDHLRRAAGHAAATCPPNVATSALYLQRHTRWAAHQHPAFADYAEDLRHLHGQLERATHRIRHPRKAGADCFGCGHPLIHQIIHGLEDEHATCTNCRTQYDQAHYRMALAAAAWDAARITIDGCTWATPASLAHDLGRPERTIRSWHQREQVQSLTRGGVLFLHVVDVEIRHAATGPAGRTA